MDLIWLAFNMCGMIHMGMDWLTKHKLGSILHGFVDSLCIGCNYGVGPPLV